MGTMSSISSIFSKISAKFSIGENEMPTNLLFTVNQFDDNTDDWGDAAGKYYVWCQHSAFGNNSDGIEIDNLFKWLNKERLFMDLFVGNHGIVVNDAKIDEYLFNTWEDASDFMVDAIKLNLNVHPDYFVSIVENVQQYDFCYDM